MLEKIRCKSCKKVIVLLNNGEVSPLPNIKIKTITTEKIITVCKCGEENIIKLNKRELEM